MLRAGLRQFVVDEPGEDRQHGERVDLLVRRGQPLPYIIAVEGERVRQLPRELDLSEGEQREEYSVTRARGQGGDRLVAVARPRPRVLVEVGGCARGRPPAEHLQAGRESSAGRCWANSLHQYPAALRDWCPRSNSVACFAAAYLVYRRRRPAGAERRLWQVTLAAYAVMTLSVVGDYFTLWMDQMFILGIGAMLIIGFGGIALGIMMLRNGFRPRITPILLMIFIPFMFAVTEVTSLGSALLPLMWGWAVAAHAVASHERQAAGASALVAG